MRQIVIGHFYKPGAAQGMWDSPTPKRMPAVMGAISRAHRVLSHVLCARYMKYKQNCVPSTTKWEKSGEDRDKSQLKMQTF